MTRRLNLKLLSILLVSLVLGAGLIHLVHGYQEGRTADSLRDQSARAAGRNDLDVAETYLKRYLAFRPDDNQALADYALLLDRRAGTPRERFRVLQVIERALGRLPDRADLRKRAIDLAMAPEIRRYRDASDHVQTLLRANPNDGQLEGLLGRCFEAFATGEDTDTRQTGDPKALAARAASLYEASIQHAPTQIDSYVRLAGLLRGLLKNASNDARADKIMSAQPNDPEVSGSGLIGHNVNSAVAYLARARYRRSFGIPGVEADITQALRLAPDDADALLAAATLAEQQGKLAESRQLLDHAVERHPTDQRLYLVRANLENRANQPAAAIAILRFGLKQIPQQPTLQWNLADLLIQEGDQDEADRIVLSLREQRTSSEAALDYLAGKSLLGRKDLVGGARLLEQARSLMTSTDETRAILQQTDLLLATTHARLGNSDRQVAAARRAMQDDPRSIPARLALAAALREQGRTNEAITAYREVASTSNPARLTLARLLIRENLQRPANRRQWDEVEALLNQAESTGQAVEETTILRAEVLVAQDRSAEAASLLTQLRDQHPDRVEPWAALADLARVRGNLAAGLAVFDQARQRIGAKTELRLARIRFLAQGSSDEDRSELAAMVRDLDQFRGEDRLSQEDALAQALARWGDRSTAEQLWTRVLHEHPTDLRVACLLFDLTIQASPSAGRTETIRRAVDRIRQIEGDNGTQWRRADAVRLIDQARSASPPDARANLAQARALSKEIHDRRPNWALGSLLDAELAELDGHPDQALNAYQQAIQDGVERPAIIRRTVQLLIEGGRTSEADRLIRRLVDQAPTSGLLARLASEMSLRQNDQQGAIDFAHQAVPPTSADPADHLWLGQVLTNLEQPTDAEIEFRRAITLDPTRPDPYLALVQNLARAKRPVEAEAVIATATKALPPEVAPATLALCFDAVGRTDQARAQYQVALARKPTEIPLQLAFAAFSLRSGDAKAAESACRAILAEGSRATPRQVALARRDLAITFTTYAPSRFNEALALIDQNIHDDGKATEDRRLKAILLQSKPSYHREAIRAFEDLAQRSPLNPAEKFVLARLYAAGPEWFQARDLLQSLLANDPQNPQILAALARLLLDHDRGSEAAGSIGQLESSEPGKPTTVELKARLLAQQGQVTAAIRLLQEQARIAPEMVLRVAATLEQIGQSAAAETLYRQHAARSDQFQAVIPLALFLGKHGQPRAAVDVCEPAWKKQATEALCNTLLQIIALNQKDVDQRQRVTGWIEEQLKHEPTNAAYLFDLANIEDMSGHYDRSETLLRQAIAAAPDKSGPLNNLAWLISLRGGKQDEALDLINRAINLEGPAPDLLDTRSLIYLARDQAGRAVTDMEAVTALKPSPLAYFHLAQAQNSAGNRKVAQDLLRKAQDGGLDEPSMHPIERSRLTTLIAELRRR